MGETEQWCVMVGTSYRPPAFSAVALVLLASVHLCNKHKLARDVFRSPESIILHLACLFDISDLHLRYL